jgi:hypothetical protein
MPSIVTIANQILCPHGGQAILVTDNMTLLADGAPALLETDVPAIVGCPFTPGSTYSPCVQIEWRSAAEMLSVGKAGVVLETSVGFCVNAAGAPQGTAVIMGATPSVDAI